MLLLDTCTFVWLVSDPGRLSKKAAETLESAGEIFLSDASVWEICLKWQAKKIDLPSPPRTWLSEQMSTWQVDRLAVELEHLYRSTELADVHRDPFDRLLVSQALTENGKIITPDPAIRQYPVTVIW